ncbi:hypothetical protein [Colwellia sp. MB3u-55]|jgi:hypothetical protein|uniref:hypothetical protein n=1 Tax=Colwellia sp. MB3u-55 TaxID=2759810 RepID=UPI0015F6E146|nr:hypothetical protein [Colwellia sp. MB3u-55]MBA6252859.1 hypothetical protein [Colwellia sp. MB3u-55]
MEDYTINNLIINEDITVTTIHLLVENNQYIIAINWYERDEPHFKMFKNLKYSQVINFSNNLQNGWNKKIIDWLSSKKAPLKIQTVERSDNIKNL